jgi:hypothetical protein
LRHIKLAVQECGLGNKRTRLPQGSPERKPALKVIYDGIAHRPHTLRHWTRFVPSRLRARPA